MPTFASAAYKKMTKMEDSLDVAMDSYKEVYGPGDDEEEEDEDDDDAMEESGKDDENDGDDSDVDLDVNVIAKPVVRCFSNGVRGIGKLASLISHCPASNYDFII
jgi:hypothetical protein